MKESEWKKFRKLREICLERLCERVLQEAERICNSDNQSAHERYGNLYGLMRDRDKELANAFNDPRRSNAFIQLMLMHKLNLIADKELDEFEDETKNAIREIVDRGDE
jgi:translation initiation factor 2 alpha subunit (eIF-2alpha)